MNYDAASFEKLIEQFPKTKVLVVGDIMVDRFIRGKVSRISPEAPVPVVKVKEDVDVPGGSGNVIMNLASLGAKVVACGIVGADPAGKSLLKKFGDMGMRTDGIKTDPSRSTTLKARVIAEHQQVVRFDYENSANISPDIQDEFERYIELVLPEVDGIILSDYGKGMITKRLLTYAISGARKLGKPVCVDPKIEHFQSYQKVTCITPNLSEALGGMRRTHLDKNGVLGLGKDILKKLGSDSVLITQGEEGMTLFEKKKATHIPAKAQEVFDVTGAGDTVISVITLCLACGATMFQAAALSNIAAGIVVGKLGTATVSPEELKAALGRNL